MALNCGHSPNARGVISVPVGRRFMVQAPVDCWVSISANPAGDATERNFLYAWILGGRPNVYLIPAGYPPQFLSAVTVDPNGDSSPTPLTFIDSGTSGL